MVSPLGNGDRGSAQASSRGPWEDPMPKAPRSDQVHAPLIGTLGTMSPSSGEGTWECSLGPKFSALGENGALVVHGDHGLYSGHARNPRAELGPGAAAKPGLWRAGQGTHPTARAAAESGAWKPEGTSERQLVLSKPLKITREICQESAAWRASVCRVSAHCLGCPDR